MNTVQFNVGVATGIAPPPPPGKGRDYICTARTVFGGTTPATTAQLGTVPSWGPEIGMLTASADRIATYKAHAAAGAQGIWLCLTGHYRAQNVAYPDNTCLWNDYSDNVPAFADLALEMWETSGMVPLLQLGGDELGTAYLIANMGRISDGLAKVHDLIGIVPTFDSDADGDWSDPGDNWVPVNEAVRAHFPSTTPLFNWLPFGWARLGYSSAEQLHRGEVCVDAWVQEFPATTRTPFTAPWPEILPGSQWDAEHNLYQPTWASDPSDWLQYVQMMGRRCREGKWTPIPGTPYNVPGGLGIGGPQNGQPVLVSADAIHPGTYTFDTDRGTTYYRAEEIDTYEGVRGVPIQGAVITIRTGLLKAGADCTG